MDDHYKADSGIENRFQILVVTDNIEVAKSLSEECNRRGQDLNFCIYNGNKLSGVKKKHPDLVLMVLTDYIEHANRIKTALTTHFKHITLPFVGALFREGRFEDQNTFDSIIYSPAHPVQISQRVEAVLRLQTMEREIVHRVKTYNEDFDIDCSFTLQAVDRPFNILFIGKATPVFMTILNALQDYNINVKAAFSSFSAFNYLHEEEFDAVVMNATENTAPSLLIVETMQRNSRLYGIPVIFLMEDDPIAIDTIYGKGVHDVIYHKAEMPEIRGRILEAANFHRIHAHMKKSLSQLRFDECIDLASRLFNRDFLIKHLTRLLNYCQKNKYELSLVALKIHPNALVAIPSDRVAQAENQIGSMIRNLVRAQDISARVTNDVMVLVFPEQGLDRLDPILDRISGIVDCASFDAGTQNIACPFTMSIDAVKVTPMPHETAEQVLTNAISELTYKHIPLECSARV
ncbi:MAG: hypothetical protein ABJ275_01385 [Maricaulaceae bacterium]